MKIETVPPLVRYPALWAATWALTGFLMAIVHGIVSGHGALPSLGGGLLYSIRFAFWGAVFGLLFAGAATLIGRGIVDRNRALVCIAVGVAVGILLPLIMQGFNLLSGDGLAAWADVLDDAVWAVPFGALAACVSLTFARR